MQEHDDELPTIEPPTIELLNAALQPGADQKAMQDAAFRKLEAELSGVVRKILAGLAPGHSIDVHTLAGWVFMKAARGAGKEFENKGHFCAWFRTVARNEIINRLRSRRRLRQEEGLEDVTTDEGAAARSAWLDLLEGLQRLEQSEDEEERKAAELFELCFWRSNKVSADDAGEPVIVPGEKAPIKEVAQSLGISTSTAYRRFDLAKQLLRRHLRTYDQPAH
jgi:RNA polymerase sigma factor (sigma-70 family)